MMEIVSAGIKDCEILASIVSESNRDVAKLLGLNIDNAPKHPSFCTPEWIIADIERGQQYFIVTEEGKSAGCVAFEQPESEVAYLNRLAVLPECRKKGLGTALVEHIVEYSRKKKVRTISIGIIAEHTELKDWYTRQGFVEGERKRFEHLPFTVLYMQYAIEHGCQSC
jgi:N-acetylglutamate synthase-like GNAT family acetyltransferase